jgi:flagellar motor switch/type III secretory pathway protein FliN
MSALATTTPAELAATTERAAPSEDWGELLLVSAVVAADLAIENLTVGDLFRLEKGSILATSHLSGTNVPLLVGGRVLAWGEFQVNGDTLGVRVAEMA